MSDTTNDDDGCFSILLFMGFAGLIMFALFLVGMGIGESNRNDLTTFEHKGQHCLLFEEETYCVDDE